MSMASLLMGMALLPAVSSLFEWVWTSGISERHHSHHDTYRVSNTLTHSLVIAMILMGVLGILLDWLCVINVFSASSSVLVGFFSTYIVVSFLIWLLCRRYQVVTYDDRMCVTPIIGPMRTIRYRDIASIRWARANLPMGYQNLRIHLASGRHVTLWGTLDVEQILIGIDRFDALENG
ncbi:MAG: hypothetical protein ACFN02_07275 [Olsenella profusa]